MREPFRPADPRAAVLWEAFRDDPLACWAAPDRAQRHELYAVWSSALLERGDECGRVFSDAERGAVQVWWSCDGTVPDVLDEARAEALFRAAGEEVADRFERIMVGMDGAHPTRPHEYLVVVGVHPRQWGRGVGGRALAEVLARWDAAGRAAYLEATTAASRRLYRRHGFTDVGEPLRVAADAPPLYPMWREPVRRDGAPA